MRDIRLFKNVWFYVILIFLLSVIVFMVFFTENRNNNVRNTTRYTIEFTLTKPSNKVVIAYDKKAQDTWLFENGAKKTLISSVVRNPVKPLRLPSTTKKVDVVSAKPTSPLTWSSSLKESAEYVNYLESEGYSSILTVDTPSYIEMYLQRGTIRKRLIIQDQILMAGNLDTSAKLPSVSTFIKNSSYLGGIK